MKLLFLVRKLPPKFLGGTEIFTLILAQALAKRGHKIVVLTGAGRGERKIDGVRVESIPELIFSPRLGTILMTFRSWQLRRKIKREIGWADIIHAFDYETILLLTGSQEIQPKLVATLQDYLLISTKEAEFDANSWQRIYLKLVSPLRLFYRRRKLKQLNNVVFISKFLANRFSLPSDVYAKVIYNPLSPDWKKITPKKETTDILYVGRLAEYKGLSILFEAIRMVIKKRKSISVKIIGEGDTDFWKRKARVIKIDQKVRFTGRLPYNKIKKEILKTKLLVVPSLWSEPLGRVIIEGMSLGKIVIASSHGGIPELIKDGETGFLVKPGDPEELAQKMVALLEDDDLRKGIGKAAQKEAWKRFDPALIAKKHEEFYTKILST